MSQPSTPTNVNLSPNPSPLLTPRRLALVRNPDGTLHATSVNSKRYSVDEQPGSVGVTDHDQSDVVWAACGRPCSRAMMMYVCQVFMSLLVVAIAILKLFTIPESADKSLWVSLLSSTLAYHLPNPSPK